MQFMRRTSILLCMIGCLCFGQVTYANGQAFYDKSTYIELPLKFSDENPPMPIAIVMIGKDNFEFVLDTGAYQTFSLTEKDLKKLQAVPTGKESGYLTNYGKYYSKEYVVKELDLGDFKLNNVLCEDISTVREKNEPNMSSTMGRGLLHHFAVLLDYANHKMVLYSPDEYTHYIDTSSWMKTTLVNDPVGIVFDGTIDNQRFRFCLDTGCVTFDNGAQRSYNLINSKYKDVFKTPLEKLDDNFVIHGVKMQAEGASLEGLNFLFADFKEPESVDAFLGNDFLNTYVVLIDFKNNLLLIKPKDR